MTSLKLTLYAKRPYIRGGVDHKIGLRCICTDWVRVYETSSRKWNRGRNGLHQLGHPVVPSILFPGQRFISPVCSGFIVADGVSRSKERSVTENIAKEAPAAINKQITGRGKSAKLHPKLLHSAVKCDEYASCKNTPSSFLCLFPTVVVQPLCLSFFFFYPPSLIRRPFMLPPHFWPLPISLVMPQCFLPINIVASF